MVKENEEWLTTNEASELTGYTVRWIRELAREREIKTRRWGWTFMIEKSDLLRYKKEKDEKREK